MEKDIVSAAIKGVMPTTNGCAVFLGNDQKTFVIYVDQFVGNAIQMALNGVKKERPLTHDLIGDILRGLEARLDHILINDAREGTFYARVFLRMENELGKKLVELDARPSDSMVLALQQKRPIFVVRAVFEKVEDMTEILERVLKQQADESESEVEDEPDEFPSEAALPAGIAPGQPLTALAPMQDVTDLAFMRVIAHYGAPDYFFTEFFRVHAQSRPEKHILRSIDENATGRPIFAQMIGEDIAHLTRTTAELLRHPVAGIDLNLGCPAPKVYKKNVGGGLLRDPARVDEILGALRAAVPGRFTVKMRIGFDNTDPFERVVDSVNRHGADLLSVHGRTVKEMYRSEVHYDFIARAVRRARCPVLANGNVTSAVRAAEIIRETGAAGVMVGRHAIRNPWIFRQCRQVFAGESPIPVTLGDVREYVDRLYRETASPDFPERQHVNKMKKYLNFVGQSVDPEGRFLHAMRRTQTEQELFTVCDEHLARRAAEPFATEAYPGVIARPNCETPIAECADLF